MSEEIKKMLEEEIKTDISKLSVLEVGSEKYGDAVQQLETIYKLKIEGEKLSIEKEKNNYLKEESIDRKIKLVVTVAELILPLMLYSAWLKNGFEFEKEGTYTSTTFRNLFGNLKPRMK